jgi:ABC-type Fe3+ transport system substrate-binding protein
VHRDNQEGIMSRISRGFALAAGLASLVAPAFAADQALIDAAKKEGALNWYTSQIVNQFVIPAKDAFEKKYGISVSYIRGDASDLVIRIVNESKAGRVQADAYDGTATAAGLKKENLALKWTPADAARLGKDYIDPEGYWIATNLYVLTPGFNTELVKKGTEPKTYADLLDPKWKGKMAWASTPNSSSAPGFIGTVLTDMGEQKGMDYLKSLAKQNIASVNVSARQILDQVIAGEYAIGLQIFNHHTIISAAQGAPSDWIAMNPAMAVLSVAGVTKDAPHPNAAKLLIDFLSSSEGQQIFKTTGYIPVDPAVPPTVPGLRPDGKNFRAIYMTPEGLDATIPKWSKVYDELFK